MGQINARLRSIEGGHFLFWCPGCEDAHVVGKTWTFNGDFERPTARPSLLVRSGHYCEGRKSADECWCTYNAKHPDNPARFRCYRCHSHITDGAIQFLADCTHKLAGQTVPIPELPEYLRD